MHLEDRLPSFTVGQDFRQQCSQVQNVTPKQLFRGECTYLAVRYTNCADVGSGIATIDYRAGDEMDTRRVNSNVAPESPKVSSRFSTKAKVN